MTDKIQEVKKLLERDTAMVYQSGKGRIIHPEEVAHEICQLFPKTEDNPNGYEPKPDEVARIMGEGGVATGANEPKFKMPSFVLTPQIEEPDEDRLLTNKEVRELGLSDTRLLDSAVISLLKAQDAKTASIMEAEFAQEKVDFGISVNEAAFKQAEAECQAKVERIFTIIADYNNLFDDIFLKKYPSVEAEVYREGEQGKVIKQALKQEGIE